MREISTEKIKIGEHVLIDGVEYVAEEGVGCDLCLVGDNPGFCSLCPIGGHIEKVKKEPKYRPYKDTDEMIADWQERYNMTWYGISMPLIWIWDKDKTKKTLVTGFRRHGVNTADAIIGMESLFEGYTYLDGSPCGKEVIE